MSNNTENIKDSKVDNNNDDDNEYLKLLTISIKSYSNKIAKIWFYIVYKIQWFDWLKFHKITCFMT